MGVGRDAGILTDPTLPDTDGDGIDDGVEVASGSDPLDENDPPPPSASELYIRDNVDVNLEGDTNNSEGGNVGRNKNINILLQPT